MVVFVGCTRNPDLPANCILLEIVEHHPDVHWVKWSVRFRRTLKDKKVLDHPYARYFKNPTRLRRLFGDEEFERLASEQNAQFLRFHERNPHLLHELLEAALVKKDEGRTEYSVDQLLGDARWGDTEIDRGTERVKINARWSSHYSRVLQMVEPALVGFFAVRWCIADGLVWVDGRAWQQFALEHGDQIHWTDPFDELPDNDWEHKA